MTISPHVMKPFGLQVATVLAVFIASAKRAHGLLATMIFKCFEPRVSVMFDDHQPGRVKWHYYS